MKNLAISIVAWTVDSEAVASNDSTGQRINRPLAGFFVCAWLLCCAASPGLAETSTPGVGDIWSLTDNPSFSSSGQSIWGPVPGKQTRTFKTDIFNLNNQGTGGQVLDGYYDQQIATITGNAQFVCAAGTFLNVADGKCYQCPTGFSHNPLLPASTPGVCFQITNLAKASRAADPTLICPAGQFPDLTTGGCYTCPSGYSHNPLLPASTPGVCFQNSSTVASYAHVIGCPAGQFNGLDGSCYSCPSGYNHNPVLPVSLPGVCYQSAYTDYTTMYNSGSRWWNSCAWKDPVFGTCWGGYNYSGDTSGGIWSGNSYYKCHSGYSHDILVPFNNNGICYRYHAAVNTTASRQGSFQACGSGEFDGLNGSCYTCPSGYVHNPLLPYNVSGVCAKSDTTTAARQGDMTLACSAGQFLDLASGQCETCPTGYTHNPLLPGNVPGVCFEQTNQTASYVGDTKLGCNAGEIFDLVTGSCFKCASGYSWNPLVPVSQPGVCFKFQLGTGIGNANFQVGMRTNYDMALRWGVKGGITMDVGSVDVNYHPSVGVDVVPIPRNPGDPEVFTLKSRQIPAQSTLGMSTTWPSVEMDFDSYVDGHAKLDAEVLYPKLDAAGGATQGDDHVSILNSSTNGEQTLDPNNPIARFRVGVDGMSLNLLGHQVLNFTGGFDPPYSIQKPVIKDPESGLSMGYTVVELGLTTPDMKTPTRSTPPYKGSHGEQVVLGSGADGTYIRDYIAPTTRTNMTVLNPASGAQDMDAGRIDFDLDGIYASLTNEPLGVVVSQSMPGLPYPKLWKIDGSIFDLNAGAIVGFREDIKFNPNLSIVYTFSKPVLFEMVAGSGQYQQVTTARVPVGSDHNFIHPGGNLQINTRYDVSDNRFTNDTDLILQPIMQGQVLSLGFQALGQSILPQTAVWTYTQDLWPDPILLTNMNFYDSAPKAVFPLDGFSNQPGGMLLVTGSNQPPVAVCKDATVNLDASGAASIVASDIDGGSYDTDGDTLSFAVDTSSFTCSDVGDNSVTLMVTDSGGNQSSCTANIRVVDNILPVLSVGADVVAEATSPGGASPVINATAQDVCGIAGIGRTPNITLFPLGTTAVTWSALDNSGNSAIATQNVTVRDTTPPVLTVPADVTTEATGPQSSVAIGSASATDIFAVTITSDAPASFAPGTTVVTWTATDANGNTTTGTQNVTVTDTTPPVVTAPAAVTVEATGPTTMVMLGSATATDLVDGPLTATPSQTGLFAPGIYAITWSSTDAHGNTGTATQTVTVADTTPPVITVPADVTAEANAVMSTVAIGTATAYDLVDGSLAVTNDAPATYPLGTKVVTYTSTDAHGNTASASQKVTVVDTTPPVLTVPADVTAEANGNPGSTVAIGTATATDIFPVTVTSNAPATYPLGTTVVTWTAVDANGNSTTGTQNVTVHDTTPPVLTVPADVSVEATGPQTSVAIGTATGTDLFGPVVIASNAPATYPLGTTVVTWTATDANGNVSTGTQNVTVKDTTPPTVTAQLVPVPTGHGESDEHRDSGLFQVVFTASDLVDPNPALTATLNGATVTSGQVVKMERSRHAEVETEHGRLEISGLSFTLNVSATDFSGNTGAASASYAFPVHHEDDNGIHRGNDKADSHSDKGKHKSEGKAKVERKQDKKRD